MLYEYFLDCHDILAVSFSKKQKKNKGLLPKPETNVFFCLVCFPRDNSMRSKRGGREPRLRRKCEEQVNEVIEEQYNRQEGRKRILSIVLQAPTLTPEQLSSGAEGHWVSNASRWYQPETWQVKGYLKLTRPCCYYLSRERWLSWEGGTKNWVGRTSKRSKFSAGRTKTWRSWWKEDCPSCRPILSVSQSPPLPTRSRWRKLRTGPPLRRLTGSLAPTS